MKKKKSWFGILMHYSKGQRGKFILSVLLSVLSITSGLMPFYCLYRVIDMLAYSRVQPREVILWCLASLGFGLIKVVFFGISTGISHEAAYNVVENLRKKLISGFIKAPLGEVQKYTIGEIKNVMVDKTENIEPPLAHVVPEGAGHIVLPLISIIALLFIDRRIALASLVTLPGAVICMMLTFVISGKSFQKYNESNAYMNSTIVEYIEGIEVIKAFGKAGVSYEKYSSAIKDFKKFVLKWMASTWVTMKLAFALFPSTLIGTLPVSLYLAYNGEIEASETVLAVMLSMSMVTSLAKLEVFSESIRQMEETVNEVDSFINIKEFSAPEKRADIKDYTVRMEDVHFSYKEDSPEVLHGINITLPQGGFTALAGPSGSGKSTAAKLISRFFDVNSGRITIGGTDIRDIPLEQLSETVSFVTQDNFLFRCSIMENIRTGNPSATDEEVKAAAEKAQCTEFINKLPMGFDTPAGEAGKRLSGGEKQRIAIARMILKNAPVIILDEATAFTDPENEDKIQQSIMKLTEGKTLLVIAHRLSTIKNADNIIVLDEGRIKAQGTQEELIKTCPLYRDMWQAHIGAKTRATVGERSEA